MRRREMLAAAAVTAATGCLHDDQGDRELHGGDGDGGSEEDLGQAGSAEGGVGEEVAAASLDVTEIRGSELDQEAVDEAVAEVADDLNVDVDDVQRMEVVKRGDDAAARLEADEDVEHFASDVPDHGVSAGEHHVVTGDETLLPDLEEGFEAAAGEVAELMQHFDDVAAVAAAESGGSRRATLAVGVAVEDDVASLDGVIEFGDGDEVDSDTIESITRDFERDNSYGFPGTNVDVEHEANRVYVEDTAAAEDVDVERATLLSEFGLTSSGVEETPQAGVDINEDTDSLTVTLLDPGNTDEVRVLLDSTDSAEATMHTAGDRVTLSLTETGKLETEGDAEAPDEMEVGDEIQVTVVGVLDDREVALQAHETEVTE